MPSSKKVSSIKGPNKRGRKPGTKNKPKAMKKVSRWGAYKPGVKNQMILRRAPLVETKQRTHGNIAGLNGHGVYVRDPDGDPNTVQPFLTEGDVKQPLNWRRVLNDDAFTNIPLMSFLRNSRGLYDYQMIGDSLTSKWLNLRLEVRFPQGEIIYKNTALGSDTTRNMMIQENYKLYMICGWVTSPLHAPVHDDSGDRRVVSKITQEDLSQHIVSQIKPYFDDNIDPLSFTPKQTTNIKIEKYVRIKPNLSEAIPTQANPIKFVNGTSPTHLPNGSIPNVMKSHTFKPNRKIHYDYGEQPTDPGTEVDYENNFPNNSWLPFCVLYAPQFASLSQQESGSTNPANRHTWAATDRQSSHCFYRWNDQHNYTDS